MNRTEKIEMAKKVSKYAIKFVVASGTSKVVAGIVNNNVKPTSRYQLMAIRFATMVVVYRINRSNDNYIDGKFDEAVAWLEKTDASI
jgi:hypothetical protein